jgi:hypothetical protein
LRGERGAASSLRGVGGLVSRGERGATSLRGERGAASSLRGVGGLVSRGERGATSSLRGVAGFASRGESGADATSLRGETGGVGSFRDCSGALGEDSGVGFLTFTGSGGATTSSSLISARCAMFGSDLGISRGDSFLVPFSLRGEVFLVSVAALSLRGEVFLVSSAALSFLGDRGTLLLLSLRGEMRGIDCEPLSGCSNSSFFGCVGTALLLPILASPFLGAGSVLTTGAGGGDVCFFGLIFSSSLSISESSESESKCSTIQKTSVNQSPRLNT